MSDLYPTKTRLALLREVANGQVLTDVLADEYAVLLFPNAPTEWQTRQKVTARIWELGQAGWVTEDDGLNWRLTDVGRAVLDTHRDRIASPYDALAAE